MKRIAGFALLVLGAWALIAPQANLGLPELRWLARHTFPGEVIAGIVLFGLGYYLLGKIPRSHSPLTPPSNQ
jgi:hypothetical protein